MYKQNECEYTLKPAWLETEHYYGILNRKLAILQTYELGDTNLDAFEKYEKDLDKFELNIKQIDEAVEEMESRAVKEEDATKKQPILDKIPELKTKRNYDSLKANYELCKTDFENDRLAQRQKDLRQDLFSSAFYKLISDEQLIMSCLPNILDGDTEKLTYDLVFTLAVVTDFFTFSRENNPLLKNLKGNTTTH